MVMTLYDRKDRTVDIGNKLEVTIANGNVVIKENGVCVYNKPLQHFCDTFKNPYNSDNVNQNVDDIIDKLKEDSSNKALGITTDTDQLLKEFVLIAREFIYGIEKNDEKSIREEFSDRLSKVIVVSDDYESAVYIEAPNNTTSDQNARIFEIRFSHSNPYKFTIEYIPLK